MSDVRYNIPHVKSAGVAGGRMRVLLSARIETQGAAFPARIREISCNSALIGAPVIPPIGNMVFLERFPIAVSGEVVRTSEDGFEINFREAIVEHELLIAIEKKPSRQPAKPIFPLDHFVGDVCGSSDSLPISRH